MNPLTPDASKLSRLRERRGVDLRVTTNITTPSEFSLENQSTPRRNVAGPSETPKKGKKKKMKNGKNLPAGVYDPQGADVLDLESPTDMIAPQDGLCGIQKLVPGLFLGFNTNEDEDEDEDEDTIRGPTEPKFTHIVSLSVRARTAESMTSTTAVHQSVDASGVHRLRLIVPRPSGARFRLSEAQLLSARDFLSLALPYYDYSNYNRQAPRPAGTDVCVLVTARLACPAEAVAVAVCYLSFMSHRSVRLVLDYIDDDDEVSDIWKGTVVRKRMLELVEAVARMAA